MTTPEQFRVWLDAPEGSRLEFKSATVGFRFDRLLHYRAIRQSKPLPSFAGSSTSSVQRLLRELRAAGRVILRGSRRGARWYPAGVQGQDVGGI